MEEFYITVIHGKTYRLKVKQLLITGDLEIYQVRGRNKTITVQSNRPMIRGKGLKAFPPIWKLNAGEMNNKNFLEKICEAIMEVVDK